MFIAILHVEFFFHDCHSLKDKRQRLRGLKDKFGAQKHIAVCESAHLNTHHQGEMSFLCTANDKRVIEANLAKIVDFCASTIDAELINDSFHWL